MSFHQIEKSSFSPACNVCSLTWRGRVLATRGDGFDATHGLASDSVMAAGRATARPVGLVRRASQREQSSSGTAATRRARSPRRTEVDGELGRAEQRGV
jgi:hypothetical protein